LLSHRHFWAVAILEIIEGENCEIDMNEPGGRHFCLLAHNVVNKLSAILGHCEILDAEAHADPQCIERLHKIRDLASSAAAMLQNGECEVEAVTRILELENAFVIAAHREPQVKEKPRKKRETRGTDSVEETPSAQSGCDSRL